VVLRTANHWKALERAVVKRTLSTSLTAGELKEVITAVITG